ncbi:DUF2190 family protein [Clostridium sp. AN503]|uniref:DUF2190 family protein n=1 Tax=Clostridium sp. AN503 TaxID=3160598 RepID=UPI00345B143C
MKAGYVQKGESLDYKNTGSTVINAGDVVVFGSRIGVAGGPIPKGETGSIHMEGVFKMDKKAGETITAGTEVYYSVDGITATKAAEGVSGELPKAGYAVADAAEAAAAVTVKLLG